MPCDPQFYLYCWVTQNIIISPDGVINYSVLYKEHESTLVRLYISTVILKLHSSWRIIICLTDNFQGISVALSKMQNKLPRLREKNLFFIAKVSRIRYRLSYRGGACQQHCVYIWVEIKNTDYIFRRLNVDFIITLEASH